MIDPPIDADEQFWVTPQPYLDLQPRDSQGRGTEAQAATRRLKVLELYANLSSAPAICKFITDLGYSVTTAKEDLSWAKARWYEMQDSTETAYEIIQRHSAKYYEWSLAAEMAGDNKLAADMLGRIERLRGFHQANVAVNINNGLVQNTTTVVSLDESKYSLEQLLALRELVAINDAANA